MYKTLIKSLIVLNLLLVSGCTDSSPRSKVEYKYYSSGSRLSATEMSCMATGFRRQVWRPNGSVVFWYRCGNVLKKENYVDGSLCGQYLEYFPSGKKRIIANLSNGGIRKHWREFDENGTCILDKILICWNVKVSANGRSNVKGKMVLLSDLCQDSESKLYFHKISGFLFSGIAVVHESEKNNIFESYSLLGGEIRGIFKSGTR